MDRVPPAPAAHKAKPAWLGAVFVVIGLAILISLGVWQLQRLKWKEGLLAHVAALQRAVPVPIAMVSGRSAGDLDFVRVRLDCPGLERAPTLRLYSVDDQGQPGARLIAACAVGDRSLLVDRGFVGPDEAAPAGRAQLDEPVIGVLRKPTPANFVTPHNNPARNNWYWRDLPAMAAALKAPPPMPATLMLEGPAPLGGSPRPAAIPAEIPNRHLEYALTWFGLAAALAGVYAAMLLRKRSP